MVNSVRLSSRNKNGGARIPIAEPIAELRSFLDEGSLRGYGTCPNAFTQHRTSRYGGGRDDAVAG